VPDSLERWLYIPENNLVKEVVKKLKGLEEIDTTAERINLDSGIHQILKQPERELIFF